MRSPFGNMGHEAGNLGERAIDMEKQLLEKIRHGHHVSRNTLIEAEDRMTLGDCIADRLTTVAGSWRFIISFLIFLGVWVSLNVAILAGPWDVYPFILLILILSMTAALQAPLIMMSQGRQEDRDRLRAAQDYEVNLKAEIEIQELHRKIDELREKQIEDLVRMQRQQMQILDTLIAGTAKADEGGRAHST